MLDKIKTAGFKIELDGDGFTVSPSDKLTQQQRDYLKSNKALIMDELLLTVVYTPCGERMELRARDAMHQVWLVKHNHNSSVPLEM